MTGNNFILHKALLANVEFFILVVTNRVTVLQVGGSYYWKGCRATNTIMVLCIFAICEHHNYDIINVGVAWKGLEQMLATTAKWNLYGKISNHQLCLDVGHTAGASLTVYANLYQEQFVDVVKDAREHDAVWCHTTLSGKLLCIDSQ